MLRFKEVSKLGELLAAALDQMGRVAALYPHLDRLDGIERVELKRLIVLCENDAAIADLAWWVGYLQKSRIQGRIFRQGSGRFLMDTTGTEFACGRPIEVYITGGPGEGWHFGRVEHAHRYGGYYFYSHTGEHCPLRDGNAGGRAGVTGNQS